MDIGEKIKFYRQQQGLTQAQLGEKVMVSRKTISGWENNHSIPDINILINLCDIFQTSLDDLIRNDPQVLDHYAQQEKKLSHFKHLKLFMYWLLPILLGLNYFKFFGTIPQVRFVFTTMVVILIFYLCLFDDWQRFQQRRLLLRLIISSILAFALNLLILLFNQHIINTFSTNHVFDLGLCIGILLMTLINTCYLIMIFNLYPTKYCLK